MSETSLHILHNRVDLIDLALFGSEQSNLYDDNGKNIHQDQLRQLKERLDRVHRLSEKLDADLPDIVQCRDLAVKLKPFLHRSKTSMVQVSEKLQSLLSMKQELEQLIGQLLYVDQVSKTLPYQDIDVSHMQLQLNHVEQMLSSLTITVKQQTEQIDVFLEMYEQTMEVLSDTCNKWETDLVRLER